MSVRRRSECHETKRCSCRFGCSSAGGGGAVVGSPGTAAVCGGGGSTTVVSAGCRCGEKGDGGGDEEEDDAAGGRVCRVSEKDAHEGATDGENVVVLACSSERPTTVAAAGPGLPPPLAADSDACGRPCSSPSPVVTESKASEDDERPPRACGNGGGCEGCASTSDAGPRA